VHQAERLRHYTIFDIGKNHNYFDDVKNEYILNRVIKKCYLPTNRLIYHLINKHNGKFKVAYSLSGVLLDQLEKNDYVIKTFQKLAKTGSVEFLSETYYHSLAYLYSINEFKEQIKMHKDKIKDLFKQEPKVFRNTELIYNNELGKVISKMGYKGILAEGADHILQWRSPNFVYNDYYKNVKLLLKNYRLSDDISFRFSSREWADWPLTAPKFAQWISAINGNGNVVNLFMDYETFGEHQWEETGIFEFLKRLPEEILKHPDNNFMMPSEVIKNYKSVSEMDFPHLVSWADIERDVSAWLGNKMQMSAISELYKLEKEIKKSKNNSLLKDWRKLQTSDHFYYMCTKWFADGDVHKYFNPYDSP